ncbi:DNA alkylation repair protein [archaeon]|jgi:3-methyladenine DNA glycosylase AlkC|nr:DNA alkylation repair protein [archaeon]MBT6697977.1 DNA alkylation repair protein [archaeon]
MHRNKVSGTGKVVKEKLILKDKLFHKDNVNYLAKLILGAHDSFDAKAFELDVLRRFPELELKERMYWIRECLEKYLPEGYLAGLKILLETLKDVEEGGDFIFGAYSEYVENNCKSVEDLEVSLNALGEFTKYCSAEFAIRFFINNYPDESFSKMMKWAGSDNFHQRRFASEGLRPKLPWAKGINFDYKKGVLVLDELFHDNERYVTRSVANHLNDISKIDPDFVVEILKRWKESKKQDEKEMQYIISHSLRTAIKKGHVKSFNFLGFNENADVSINGLGIVDRRLRIGDSLEFSFEILAKAAENLVVDYKITYPTPSSRISTKVFKIKKVKIESGGSVSFSKRHPFRKMTTKRLYSGNYKLEIQVNGEVIGTDEFYLEV